MVKRQVVVISGKACSGKTGLADLLEKEFHFHVIRTRQVLAAPNEPAAASSDRLWLNERARQQDHATGSRWMLYATQQVLKDLDPTTPVVVDYLNSLTQVLQFRREFGESL